LGKNEIENLEPDAFLGLTNLRDIWLITNKIHYLLPDTFLGLNNLSDIRLNDNKIQYLHPDLFLHVSSLSSLYLENNPMMKIPTDRHFINSPSFRKLHISDCNVSSILVETFANVSGLELIDLSRNHLKYIDVNILTIMPQLSTFYIYENPLQCVCQLQEVWRWCQNHSITTGHIIQPECDSPSEVEGMWWGVLQYSQCLHDNISFHGDYNSAHYEYTDGDLVRIVHEYMDRDHTLLLPEYTGVNKYDMPAFIKYLRFLAYVQTSVFAVLLTFGAAGNVIILIIIVCNKEMHTVPNIYILNLAISDFISLITNLPLAHIDMISENWLHSDFLCKIFEFSRRVSIGLSAYSVALLSFQRYKVTANPIQSRIHSPVNWRVTAATICGVWFLASLFVVPSALSVKFRDKVTCVVFGTYYDKVVWFELLVLCILPLCVIVFFYVMTARQLVKSALPISEEIQHPQANKRKNTAKILLGLCIVFVISYVPYHIILVYATFKNYLNMELLYIRSVSTWLLVFNSCLNPVALCCSSLAFRSQFKRCLMCFKRRTVVTTTQELTEAN
jgi:Leucine-rich repeat (LRR) protein